METQFDSEDLVRSDIINCFDDINNEDIDVLTLTLKNLLSSNDYLVIKN
jgi:hypothetical protein